MKSHRLQIAKSFEELNQIKAHLKGDIGFVPTMGYLHAGHLSLIELAKKENDHVIVSIFVNPKQFNAKDDFQTYPRDEKNDIKFLTDASVDILFLPEKDTIYPEGYKTYVFVENLSNVLEGKSRAGHFKGVATIVNKLFNLVQPTRAYFGQKDAQQIVIIKKMVEDLNISVAIVVGKTIREADGLAISSRNIHLNTSERKQAVVLHNALLFAQEQFKKNNVDSKSIISGMKKLINTTSGKISYISIADPQTLEELKIAKDGVLVSLAVQFGKTRLIDNIYLHD